MRVRVKQSGYLYAGRLHRVEQPFNVIVADPPWSFGDALGKRGAADKYDVLTIDQIKSFKLPRLADDCVLFLWRVSSMQQEALDVARAWGFKPSKGEIIWRKMTETGKEHFGMGRIVRGAHEACIIATRGKPEVLRRDVRSIFSAPVPRSDGRVVHSAKPDLFFEIVAGLFAGPRASLFERMQRPGFHCFGMSELSQTG
jgi:N6-adenosine-specific RNA methylase IME4